MLVSECILKHGTPALNDVQITGLVKTQLPSHPDLKVLRPFYQLVRIHGNVLYSYPHGTPLLSLPFVAILNAAGLSSMDSKEHYYYRGEFWTQKIVASFLMAGAVCIFFESASAMLPWYWSMIIAVGAGFGSQIWSTATRSLWSHTWEVFLAACLVLLLLKREQRSSRWMGPMLATLVSWMYFVRPTGAITVVAVSIFIVLCHRDWFSSYAITGSAWMLGFLIYSLMTFGDWLPDYYRQGSGLHVSGWLDAFAGSLISPSRGLLVFVPSIFIVLYMVVRHWKAIANLRLARLAMGITCAQLIMIAGWPRWWGGASYGPRLFTDVIPWLVVLAIIGLRARLDDVAKTPVGMNGFIENWLLAATALVLILLSIAIKGYGAVSIQTRIWNDQVDVDAHPERVWDWRSPQFLAGLGKYRSG
jgi:hypothetical protein